MMELRRNKFYVADVRRAIVATSRLLDKSFDITENASGCYLEKNGVKVSFAKRNGTFVLLAKKQVQNLVASTEVDGDMAAAREHSRGATREDDRRAFPMGSSWARTRLRRLCPCQKGRQKKRLRSIC